MLSQLLRTSGIRVKVIGLAVTCTVVAAIGLTGVSVLRCNDLVNSAEEELDSSVGTSIDNTLRGLLGMVTTEAASREARLESTLKTSNKLIADAGGLRIGDKTVTWELPGKDGATQSVTLPETFLGDTLVTPTLSWEQKAPIVDDLVEMTGMSGTVFLRTNEDGDMMRLISSSKSSGSDTRPIGTAIKAVLPNGGKHPVIEKVLAGETYGGIVDLPSINAVAITRYMPLKNGDRVVGMMGMGVGLTDLQEISKNLSQANIGENGIAEMVSTKGDQRGKVRLSSVEGRIGQVIADATDENGVRFVDEALTKVVSSGDGTFVTTKYTDPDVGPRTVRLAYFPGWDWAIALNTVDADFATPINRMENMRDSMVVFLAVAAVVVTLIAVGIAYVLGLSVVQPIVSMRDRMREIADGDGDLTQRVDDRNNDEVGQLGRAFNNFVSKVADTVRSAKDSAAAVQSSAATIGSTIDHLSNTAKASAQQSEDAKHASDEVNNSVVAVSDATEQMISAIQEISRSAAEATSVGQQAQALSAQTQQAVSALGDSSQEIGKVIAVISAVAAQTNLLALNATIEAARAGDAGKGFAVVADEVKQLASETAAATEEISRKVQVIQNDSGTAVTAIDQITEVVNEMTQYQTTIAAAVEEQSATTSEVSRGVSEAAGGIASIAELTTRAGDGANDAAHDVQAIHDAAAELNRVTRDLDTRLSAFTL